jgi:hypothetical protein
LGRVAYSRVDLYYSSTVDLCWPTAVFVSSVLHASNFSLCCVFRIRSDWPRSTLHEIFPPLTLPVDKRPHLACVRTMNIRSFLHTSITYLDFSFTSVSQRRSGLQQLITVLLVSKRQTPATATTISVVIQIRNFTAVVPRKFIFRLSARIQGSCDVVLERNALFGDRSSISEDRRNADNEVQSFGRGGEYT